MRYKKIDDNMRRGENETMLTLIILLILVGGFFIGLRRGLVNQIVHLTSLIVSLVVAYLFFNDIAPHLRWIPYPGSADSQWDFFSNTLSVEDIYYQAIAFAILFFGTNFLWRALGSILDFLADLPLLRIVNRWLGGAFGFMKVYLIVFLLLYVVAFVPIVSVQHAVTNSALAQTMVQHTPILSEKIEEL